MRGLTLWQPWCAIVVDGATRLPHPKKIENRPWAPWKSVIGTRIALHAGLRYDREAATKYWEVVRTVGIREGVKGAIMGTAIVAGFVKTADDPWFFGPFGWLLDDVRALAEPIPFKGKQGLWTVPEEIEKQIAA